MKDLNLNPPEYSQGRKAADTYDTQQLIALRAERRRALEGRSFLGRAATRFASQFYRGELGTNTWLVNRHTSSIRARKNIYEDE